MVASTPASKEAGMSNLFGDDDTPQSKGGRARAEALPAGRRKEIAKAAAAARWAPDD